MCFANFEVKSETLKVEQLDVLHVSIEYFPAAKAGGLADVVGALPKYLNENNFDTAVVIPKHHTTWILAQKWNPVYKGKVKIGSKVYLFSISSHDDFDSHALYVLDLPGLFDRQSIYIDTETGYGYTDDHLRNIVFQTAVLEWLNSMRQYPKTLHCHDHHTGLIPFMINHCTQYQKLNKIPTVFTIHNGAYHGAFDWKDADLLPSFDRNAKGLLDWDNQINPLACGVKCCWKLTTVSPGYMDELRYDSNGLESLFNQEKDKSVGVINGIDTGVWNPATDTRLDTVYKKSIATFKQANKKALAEEFDFDIRLPLVTFIGRLAYEKGAQILPDLFCRYLDKQQDVTFLVLGTGDKNTEKLLTNVQKMYPQNIQVRIGYDESLAHQLYAGSDFLLMPSKVEPCGLNQMYAMRYGTIPIVNNVGGLRDTVIDLQKKDGYGICFQKATVFSAMDAVQRAAGIYQDSKEMKRLQKKVFELDFSWNASAQQYADIYQTLR